MKDIVFSLVKKAIESFVTDEMIESAKHMLIAELKELAKKTDNEIDDVVVDIIEKALK